METFQIETAQNIKIAQYPANLGDRILAYVIDAVVMFVYLILAGILLASLDVDRGESWTFILILGLPVFFYHLLFESLMNGQSLGKRAVRIRVVNLDGTKPGFEGYCIRWILRLVDISICLGGVAVLTILARGKGQRLGDIAAGTSVVTERKRDTLQATLTRDIPDGYVPKFPQVTVFGDRDMQTIKDFYDSARRNGDHGVIISLNDRIKKVAKITTDMNPLEFVDTAINDYIYYTQRV